MLIKFETVGITLKLMCSPGDSQIAPVIVVLDNVLQVPGCSEIEIMAKVHSTATGGSWIVEGPSQKLCCDGSQNPSVAHIIPVRMSFESTVGEYYS